MSGEFSNNTRLDKSFDMTAVDVYLKVYTLIQDGRPITLHPADKYYPEAIGLAKHDANGRPLTFDCNDGVDYDKNEPVASRRASDPTRSGLSQKMCDVLRYHRETIVVVGSAAMVFTTLAAINLAKGEDRVEKQTVHKPRNNCQTAADYESAVVGSPDKNPTCTVSRPTDIVYPPTDSLTVSPQPVHQPQPHSVRRLP